MPFFNVLSFVLSRQIAANQGISDPSRQNYYGLLGGVMGSNPVGLGVTVALSNQEAEDTPATGAPTLASIDPATAKPNSTVSVTLEGTNFVAPVSIGAPDGSGITATIVDVSSTTITASLTVSANAQQGNVPLTVTTANGTSGSVAFSIGSGVAPTTTTILPSTAGPGTTIAVCLSGSNFVPGSTSVSVATKNPNDVAVQNVLVDPSGNQLYAELVIAGNAPAGTYPVAATTAAGTSQQNTTFTIDTSYVAQVKK